MVQQLHIFLNEYKALGVLSSYRSSFESISSDSSTESSSPFWNWPPMLAPNWPLAPKAPAPKPFCWIPLAPKPPAPKPFCWTPPAPTPWNPEAAPWKPLRPAEATPLVRPPAAVPPSACSGRRLRSPSRPGIVDAGMGALGPPRLPTLAAPAPVVSPAPPVAAPLS